MSQVSDLRALISTELAEVHHCLPGKVVSWDGSSATVRPVIDKQLANGEKLPAPQIVRVPVKWMVGSGGAALISVPLAAGDDVVIHFCDRALEEWLQGIDGVPSDPRQFDITDAFCTPVLRPSTGANADTENVSIQFGPASLKITPDGRLLIIAPAGMVVTAPTVLMDTPLMTVSGNVAFGAGGTGAGTVQGSIHVTGDVTAGTISLQGHHHQEHDGPSTGPAQP